MSLTPSNSSPLAHPTKSRATPGTGRRLPANKNQALAEKDAEIAALRQQLALGPAAGGAGETVVISAAQLQDLQKDRDNFKLVAQKLQKELRTSKVELDSFRSSTALPSGGAEQEARLRELEEQLKSREATIARLRSESARRDAELVQMDSAAYQALQNPVLERERMAKQREELDQMRAEEAKAEVAKLRNQIVQLKRIMDRRISNLEENLEEETKNSVNLLAEKRQLEEQVRGARATASPNYFRGSTPAPSSPNPTAAEYIDESYPEPDLRRGKSQLYAANPSGQLADVPLLSAADFGNPPPLRPKQAAIAASKPTPLCTGCTIV